MDSVEASGKSVDDAIVQALARLGRRHDEVEVMVLQEPSRGVRGVGSREARVRVWLKRAKAPTSRPAPAASGAVLTPDMADHWFEELEEAQPAPAAPPRKPSAFRPTSPPPPPAPVVDDADEDYDEDDEDEDFEDDEEFEEDEEEGAPAQVITQPVLRAVTVAPKPTPPDLGELDSERGEGQAIAPDDVARTAGDILRTMLRHMNIPAGVEIASRDPLTLNINLNGDPELVSLLIGRRGETLAALQLLVNLLLNRKVKERYRMLVDVEHYRQHRDDNLRSLAMRVAQQVQQSQRAMTLEPMTPYERRIVHMTLQESPAIQTQSTGEGEQRRVVVSLKRPSR